MGGVDRSLPRRFAADLVPFDQGKHVFRCGAETFNEAGAVGGSERRADGRRRVPYACVHKAHVAPRSAMADALGLEHEAVEAALGAMERRRQPGETAADDGHIGRGVAV